MKATFCVSLILLILGIQCQNFNNFDVKEALRRQKQQQQEQFEKNMENLPPNVVVFTFEDDKINEMEHFARIIPEFMATIGVTTNIVNYHKTDLLATIPPGKSFDTQIVWDNFKGILKKVDIGDFTKQNNNYIPDL